MPRLNLGDQDVELGAVTDFLLENRKNGGARIIRKQIFQRNQAGLKLPFPPGLGQLIEAHGLIERKFANGGAADFRQVCTATKFLADVMSKGANVGAGGTFDREASDGTCDFGEPILEEFNGSGPKFNGLIFPGELVGGTPRDLFR